MLSHDIPTAGRGHWSQLKREAKKAMALLQLTKVIKLRRPTEDGATTREHPIYVNPDAIVAVLPQRKGGSRVRLVASGYEGANGRKDYIVKERASAIFSQVA